MCLHKHRTTNLYGCRREQGKKIVCRIGDRYQLCENCHYLKDATNTTECCFNILRRKVADPWN